MALKDGLQIYYTLDDTGDDSKGNYDIIYVTRIQKERFADEFEYEQIKNVYILGKEILSNAKQGFRIMHPLPRVDEIDKSLDETPHAIYFEQAANGIPVRKALLALVLGKVK